MSDATKLTADEQTIVGQFDDWLKDGGPAALVIRELLEPVEGPDGVFFPATFAAEQGNDPDRFRGGYNIDYFPDGTNVCLVDTVGSQGNRIEPMFAAPDLAELVPQVSIRINDTKTVSLLEAGHRSGDAIVRCSALKADLDAAFKELLNGNALPLAKIAPTSLLFGVWDSRGTQAKLPRLVSATIRAFNVYPHTRHAQYNPVINFKKEGLLDGIDASDDDLAVKGYVSQPIGKQVGKPDPTHGGVQLMTGKDVQGSIRRDSTLGLAALRRLNGTDDVTTMKLRRYILGLALVALTAEQETYLRQGCNLVPSNEGKSRTFEVVQSNGVRVRVFAEQSDADEFVAANPKSSAPLVLNPTTFQTFALRAANEFGIHPAREVPFKSELAKKDIKGDADKLKGEIVSLDASERTFKLKVGKKSDQMEIDVVTNDSTVFAKGKEDSTFGVVVVHGAKLDVELTNGVAVKVICKK